MGAIGAKVAAVGTKEEDRRRADDDPVLLCGSGTGANAQTLEEGVDAETANAKAAAVNFIVAMDDFRCRFVRSFVCSFDPINFTKYNVGRLSILLGEIQ